MAPKQIIASDGNRNNNDIKNAASPVAEVRKRSTRAANIRKYPNAPFYRSDDEDSNSGVITLESIREMYDRVTEPMDFETICYRLLSSPKEEEFFNEPAEITQRMVFSEILDTPNDSPSGNTE